MLNIPESVKNLFKQDSIKKNFRVHFPNGEYRDLTNADMEGENVRFTSSISSGAVIKFGLCESPVLEFTCHCNKNLKHVQIYAQIEIDISSLSAEEIAEYGQTSEDVEYPFYPVPYGYFTISECKRSGDTDTRKVVAYNVASQNIRDYIQLYFMNVSWDSSFSYNLTIKTLFNLMFRHQWTASDYENAVHIQQSSARIRRWGGVDGTNYFPIDDIVYLPYEHIISPSYIGYIHAYIKMIFKLPLPENNLPQTVTSTYSGTTFTIKLDVNIDNFCNLKYSDNGYPIVSSVKLNSFRAKQFNFFNVPYVSDNYNADFLRYIKINYDINQLKSSLSESIASICDFDSNIDNIAFNMNTYDIDSVRNNNFNIPVILDVVNTDLLTSDNLTFSQYVVPYSRTHVDSGASSIPLDSSAPSLNPQFNKLNVALTSNNTEYLYTVPIIHKYKKITSSSVNSNVYATNNIMRDVRLSTMRWGTDDDTMRKYTTYEQSVVLPNEINLSHCTYECIPDGVESIVKDEIIEPGSHDIEFRDLGKYYTIGTNLMHIVCDYDIDYIDVSQLEVYTDDIRFVLPQPKRDFYMIYPTTYPTYASGHHKFHFVQAPAESGSIKLYRVGMRYSQLHSQDFNNLIDCDISYVDDMVDDSVRITTFTSNTETFMVNKGVVSAFDYTYLYPQARVDYALNKSIVNYISKNQNIDFMNMIEDYIELCGLCAIVNPITGNYEVIDLTDTTQLYPAIDLYPNTDLYPMSQAEKVTRTGYRSLWYDDKPTTYYDRVQCNFKVNNETVFLYYDIVDHSSESYYAEDYQQYDISDNYFVKNNLLTQAQVEEVLELLGEKLKSFKYYPCDIQMRGLPYLEPGDGLAVVTRDSGFSTYNLRQTISGIQSLTTTVETRGE